MIWTNQQYDWRNQKVSVFLTLYRGKSLEMLLGGQSVLDQSSSPYRNLSKLFLVKTWGMGLSSFFFKIFIDICMKSYCKLKNHLFIHEIRHLSKLEITAITKSDKREYSEKWITFPKAVKLNKLHTLFL